MGRYVSGSELILKEGVCTQNGNLAGTTVIDASLIGKPDYPSGLQIRILSGTYQLVTRTIESFDPITGTVTVPGAIPFPGQIVRGTGYVIMGVSATSADVLDLIDIISPEDGTTTNAGAGGLTVIDTARTEGLDYWKSQTLLITSGACDGQVREITAYNNATQTFTVSPAFSSNIIAGVTYRILSQLPADIDITALQADVGDASASTLGSLYGIVGNPAAGQDLATRIGYEGATSLAAKLTAARAALIDEITALRMAELDAANLPADIDIIKADTQIIEDSTLKASPTAGSLARYIASGGTALGTPLGDSKSLTDALGHTGLARLDSGLDSVLADGLINGAGTVLPANKSLVDHLGGAGFTTGTDSLKVIAADVAQILDMTRSEGLVAVTAAETSLFIDDTPTIIINGLSVKIDLTNMAAGDTYVLREYYRITNGGAYFQVSDDAANTYVGAQTPVLKVVSLEAYRYGCKVTAQKTAGTDRSFQVETMVEA